MNRIGLLLVVLALCVLSAGAQNSKKPAKSKQTPAARVQQPSQKSSLVNPDSLRRYLRAVQAQDSAALRRYGDLGVPDDPPGRARILLLARMDRDSIVLRWAPSNSGGWASANKAGYIVERLTLGTDGKADTSTLMRLGQGTLLPWTREEWNRRAPRSNRYAAVAAEALHGKSFATGMQGNGEAAAFRSAVDDLTNRYGFSVFAADMDPLAADGLALRMVDRRVRNGERYVYRVFSPRRSPEFLLDTAYTFGSAVPFQEPAPPSDIHVQEDDKMLIVRWSHPPQGERYSGYLVSRSEDGGKTYTALTASPLVNPTPASASQEAEPNYTDTSVVNYRKYRYQVRGISPFGDMSRVAEVEGMARDLTPPPAPVGLKTVQLSRTSARITWQVEDSTADMRGFVVLRGPLPLSGYHLPGEKPFPPELAADRRMLGRFLRDRALSRQTRAFVDTSATPLEPYYSVAAVDTAGNYLQSLPIYSEIIDTLPPAMPKGLTGSVDTNGVVRLHWRRGPEPTLLGYRVYQANDSTHHFHIRTPEPIADTVFVDTVDVKTLTRHVYYRIAAVSNRYVHSPLTPILSLRRPDLIRPAPPVFTNAFVSDSSVQLRWASSPSRDARWQVLSRRFADSTEWKTLDTLAAGVEMYTDRKVIKRKVYEYRLVTIDSSGLHSEPAMPVLARPYDTGIKPPVSDLRINYDSQRKTARLAWSYAPIDRDTLWFVVYRSAAGAPLTQYRAVKGSDRNFDDDGISPGSYQYAIKVRTAAGGEPPLSIPVQVEVR